MEEEYSSSEDEDCPLFGTAMSGVTLEDEEEDDVGGFGQELGAQLTEKQQNHSARLAQNVSIAQTSIENLKSTHRYFDKDFVIECFADNNVQTNIRSIGKTLWKSATMLADFFENNVGTKSIPRLSSIENLNVLELGAGTGLTGLVLAFKAKRVILTDHPSQIKQLEHNCNINKSLFSNSDVVSVCSLDWDLAEKEIERSPVLSSSKLDLIVASDCVYFEELQEPLFNTIKALLRRNPSATLVFGFEKRYAHSQAFFQRLLNELGLIIYKVPNEAMANSQNSNLWGILYMYRKPESET